MGNNKNVSASIITVIGVTQHCSARSLARSQGDRRRRGGGRRRRWETEVNRSCAREARHFPRSLRYNGASTTGENLQKKKEKRHACTHARTCTRVQTGMNDGNSTSPQKEKGTTTQKKNSSTHAHACTHVHIHGDRRQVVTSLPSPQRMHSPTCIVHAGEALQEWPRLLVPSTRLCALTQRHFSFSPARSFSLRARVLGRGVAVVRACVPCRAVLPPPPTHHALASLAVRKRTALGGLDERKKWGGALTSVCVRARDIKAHLHTDGRMRTGGGARSEGVVLCGVWLYGRARSPDRLTHTEKTANARHRAPPPYQKKKGGGTMDMTTRKQRRRRKRRESTTTTTTPPMTLMMLLLLDDDDGGIDRHDTARQRKKSRGTDEHLHQTRTSDWCIGGGRGGEDGDKNSTSFMAHARARPFSSHRTKKKTNHSSQRSVLRCDARGWGVG